MKIVVDAETKKILGAAILGTGGDEAIHGMLDIMNAGAPYTALAARRADPPDRIRADPDAARRPAAGAVRNYGLNRAGVSCAWVMPTSVMMVPSGWVMITLANPPTSVDCAVATIAAVVAPLSFW